ncbi:MAG: hypothetical protein ACRC7N_06070 [Clostridium sp.]
MQGYEYKVEIIIPISRDNIEHKCNFLGEKGWRLVAFNDGYLVFMREVSEG